MDFTIQTMVNEDDKNFFVRMEFESARENRAVSTNRPEEEVFKEHRQELLDFINSKTKTGIFLAKKEKTPVGFIWVSARGQMEPWDLEAPPAWIYDIAVLPEFRGQGLGKQLLRHAEQWARSEGFDRIGLHVFGFNEVARHLYRASDYATLNVYFQKQIEINSWPPQLSGNGLHFREVSSETDQQYIYNLGYQRFAACATAFSPIRQKTIMEKYQSQWQASSTDKPTDFTCLAERGDGSLAGFAWAYQSKGDLGDQPYVWVRNIEVNLTEKPQCLIGQLLAQVEHWAIQNGLNTIRLGAHHLQTDLIEVLRENLYQETNLFLQKRF